MSHENSWKVRILVMVIMIMTILVSALGCASIDHKNPSPSEEGSENNGVIYATCHAILATKAAKAELSKPIIYKSSIWEVIAEHQHITAKNHITVKNHITGLATKTLAQSETDKALQYVETLVKAAKVTVVEEED